MEFCLFGSFHIRNKQNKCCDTRLVYDIYSTVISFTDKTGIAIIYASMRDFYERALLHSTEGVAAIVVIPISVSVYDVVICIPRTPHHFESAIEETAVVGFYGIDIDFWYRPHCSWWGLVGPVREICATTSPLWTRVQNFVTWTEWRWIR